MKETLLQKQTRNIPPDQWMPNKKNQEQKVGLKNILSTKLWESKKSGNI